MTDKKGYTVHIVGGGIGGVGKSTTGKLLAEYYLEIKKDNWLVDADELLPDVGLAYQKDLYQSFRGEKTLTLSDKEKKFDRQIIFSGNSQKAYLLDKVWELAEDRDVLLILPSQVEQYVDTWLEENDFASFATSNNPIHLKYWFVCNGTEPSVKMFGEHLEKHPQLSHVFVENRGRDSGVDWDFFDRSGEIKKLREEKKCHRLKIDRLILSPETWELINKDRLTFKDASTKKNSTIKKAEQNRITKLYLEKEKIVLFDCDSLASIYRLDYHQLPSEIDRSNYWKLDPLLENDGVTIAAIPKGLLNTIAYWWKRSQREEQLTIWSDDFLLELELLDRITKVIIEDLKVIVEDRQEVCYFNFPQLYLSDRERIKIDNLAYRDVLNGFDRAQFSSQIKGERIDRPTYHRVRKYVDLMNCLYREIGID